MKKYFIVLFVSLSGILFAQHVSNYSQYFTDSALRIDFYKCGDAKEEITTIKNITRLEKWAGSKTVLLDPFANGQNKISVYDVASNQLLFTKYYNTYFYEYKTTTPALEGKKKIYQETIIIPDPKKPVMIVFEERDKQNIFQKKYQQKLNPADFHIHAQKNVQTDYIYKLTENSSFDKKVDLVFIGDGYTLAEKSKFEKDVKKQADVLFSVEPYASRKNDFNITGILRYSSESGVDDPAKKKYVNNSVHSTFNSLESDRYLLTEEVHNLYDIATQVPVDAVVIIANTEKYGGGGIYNFYATFTADNNMSDFVFLHEFGHSFAGLADEYYTSDVAYNEFYPVGTEPAEQNITALLDPENLKWKKFVSEGIEIPTKWGKEIFDSLSAAPQTLSAEMRKKVDQMKKNGASETDIKKVRDEYSKRISEVGPALNKFVNEHPLRGKVGAFEGAGYASKGLYRPTVNSIMHKFTKEDKTFHPVNINAISKMIDYYTK